MSETNVALFIDTNGFLQMKDFNQVAWRGLFPKAETITLFVCNAIISELDKHKVSTNKRRRDRARNALRLIEEAAATPDMTLSVRESAPKVDIAIWRGKPDWSDFPDLDSANPDDYLVAAAATSQGIVLSHDTGPRIRARIAGVRAESPPDDWLLPAEQTDDQRKIGQLARELEAAQNARPRLQVVLPPDDPITIKVVSVPYLGAKATGRLAEIVLGGFPKHRLVARSTYSGLSMLNDPNYIGQTQIDAYDQEYASFASGVQTYFVTLHEKVARHALAQTPPGSVANIGNVSAKNLTLTIETDGNIDLLADREDAEKILNPISLPEPPKPPRARSILDPVRLMGGMNKPRNATAFYWSKRPAIVDAQFAGFECADFRPAREEDFGVLLHAVGELPSAGRILVSASAEHHETVTADRAVIFERAQALWLDPLVQGLLPDIVQEAFAKLDGSELPTW